AGRLATVPAALDGPVCGVLSLLPLDERPHPRHLQMTTGAALSLALLQALGDTGSGARLWWATRGAVTVGSADPVTSAAQSLLWGLGRVAALEHPERWGGLVDLPEELDASAAARLLGVLAGWEGPANQEDQVAVRENAVYGRRLVRAALGDAVGVRAWRPRATTLVTGGTGRVGTHPARWLAQGGGAHPVL